MQDGEIFDLSSRMISPQQREQRRRLIQSKRELDLSLVPILLSYMGRKRKFCLAREERNAEDVVRSCFHLYSMLDSIFHLTLIRPQDMDHFICYCAIVFGTHEMESPSR